MTPDRLRELEGINPTCPCAVCSGIRELVAEARRLQEERDKLQAFKTWVHAYLDGQGVPHHPPGTHGAEGCRIGDRMDWVWAEFARLRSLLSALADAAGPFAAFARIPGLWASGTATVVPGPGGVGTRVPAGDDYTRLLAARDAATAALEKPCPGT